MNARVFLSKSPAQTDQLARLLAEEVRPGTVIALEGPLGAGKTRFTQALAERLGVDRRDVSSPTFTLVHEYNASIPIYHFDLYRLTHVSQFDSLGPGEYWTRGDGVCLIEWAERADDRLPGDRWRIAFEHVAGDELARTIRIRAPIDLEAIAQRFAASFDDSRAGT